MLKQYDRCRVISGDYIGETGKIYSICYGSASVLLDCDVVTLESDHNLDSLLYVFKLDQLKSGL